MWKITKNEYTMICKKCNTEYTVFETPEAISRGKYRKYCSRKCANSRMWNDNDKKKISFGMTGKHWYYVESPCKNCDIHFIHRSDDNRMYCSSFCASSHIGRKIGGRSEIACRKIREQFRNGRKVKGGYTKWYNYKNIRVQGNLELRMCKILDKMKSLNLIKDWEYTNDRFPYTGLDGKQHTYLVDFKVWRNDNTSFYVETKGYERENDKIKWKSVINTGYSIEIYKRKDLKTMENIL